MVQRAPFQKPEGANIFSYPKHGWGPLFLLLILRVTGEEHVHRVLLGKPEGKKSLRRPRRRSEDNIKMDIEEVGGGCGDWIELAQDRDS
jgi:hypothetical protein